MLVRIGFVAVLVPFDVCGFRLVLARGWHGVWSAARTGAQSVAGTGFLSRT
jgi:hypothetical protein